MGLQCLLSCGVEAKQLCLVGGLNAENPRILTNKIKLISLNEWNPLIDDGFLDHYVVYNGILEVDFWGIRITDACVQLEMGNFPHGEEP